MQILVTGAAGSLGQTLLPGLTAAGHTVTGLDLVEPPNGSNDTSAGGWHVADCTDPTAVLAAVSAQPVDAIVHLAGNPEETNLTEALTSHVITTAALLDAMVARGVSRIVYASSNHAVGRVPTQDPVDSATTPRPDTYYGVGKVAAEALLRLFADRHGIDAVACRIGSFLPEPTTRRNLATWLSPADCVRTVDAALTTQRAGYSVIYGISANTRATWDLEPGRALGYHPQDDAEMWADLLPVRPEDAEEAAFVGGPYATSSFERPALG